MGRGRLQLSGAREERFAVAVASLGRAVRERPILWPLDLWDLRSFTGEQQGASILSRSHLTFTGKEEELAMDPELGWGVGLQRDPGTLDIRKVFDLFIYLCPAMSFTPLLFRKMLNIDMTLTVTSRLLYRTHASRRM